MANENVACVCCPSEGAYANVSDSPNGPHMRMPGLTSYQRNATQNDGEKIRTSDTGGLEIEACPGSKEIEWEVAGIYCPEDSILDYLAETVCLFFQFMHCPFDGLNYFEVAGRTGCLEGIGYNIADNTPLSWSTVIKVFSETFPLNF